MVYLFNQYISPKKPIKQALKAIYGINIKKAQNVGNVLCINTKKRFNTLKLTQIRKIGKHISTKYQVGGLLQKQKIENIKKK